jgi:hypothetical protein
LAEADFAEIPVISLAVLPGSAPDAGAGFFYLVDCGEDER